MDDGMGDFLKLFGGVLDTGELWGGKVGRMSTKPTHKNPTRSPQKHKLGSLE